MKRSFLLFGVALAGLLLMHRIAPSPTTYKTSRDEAGSLVRVTRVIDGDTIEIAGGERVRYLGMDAPETVDPRKPAQCFGKEASEENAKLVQGKFVFLERDVTDRDKYGRLLRYVYLKDESSTVFGKASPMAGGMFINLKLVENGYARAFAFPPDLKYASDFAAAERVARGNGEGLWKAPCR